MLIEQSAAAFGVMLSTVTPSFPVAIAIAAPLLTVLSLTGGMYANGKFFKKIAMLLIYFSWPFTSLHRMDSVYLMVPVKFL